MAFLLLIVVFTFHFLQRQLLETFPIKIVCVISLLKLFQWFPKAVRIRPQLFKLDYKTYKIDPTCISLNYLFSHILTIFQRHWISQIIHIVTAPGHLQLLIALLKICFPLIFTQLTSYLFISEPWCPCHRVAFS